MIDVYFKRIKLTNRAKEGQNDINNVKSIDENICDLMKSERILLKNQRYEEKC